MINQPRHSKSLLNIYLYFRLTLGLLLLVLHYSSQSHDFLGVEHPHLFRWGIVSYLGLCAITVLLFPIEKLSRSYSLLIPHFCIDLGCMFVLIHASGGIQSGLGYLLLIFVAMSTIFLQRKIGLFFAAIASLLILGESVYLTLHVDASINVLFSSGILGVLIFITALVFQFFTDKIQRSSLEASLHASHARHLQKLAQAIITRMRTGIIVIDAQGKIDLINDSALQLLDLSPKQNYQDVKLEDISALKPVFEQLQDKLNPNQTVFHSVKNLVDLRISTAPLDMGEAERTVLYVEDNRVLTQQAQSLKLASLGRLSASIAHEVRNPLGAISHAGQLLNESEVLDDSDQRLVNIILEHSQRVNQIIEDTLVLSRRKERQPDVINLYDWLPRFKDEFSLGKKVEIELIFDNPELWIRFDPIHLTQILSNLSENGARYSLEHTGVAKVLIHSGINKNKDTAYIEVIDDGLGIADDKASEVFEPFYTTAEKGSGSSSITSA